jgi:hypothetical protein
MRQTDRPLDRIDSVLATWRMVSADPELKAVYEAGFFASLRNAERLTAEQNALRRAIQRTRKQTQ